MAFPWSGAKLRLLAGLEGRTAIVTGASSGIGAAIARALGRNITLVDSAQNCATAVQETLDRQALRSSSTQNGELHVALTDAADTFLNVARDALQLSFGEIELRRLP